MDHIEIIKGIITKLKITDDNYKITNLQGDFYSDIIILPIDYDLEKNLKGYRAVPYEVWGEYLENEIPKNKVKEINQKINEVKTENEEQNEVIENMMMNILDLMYPE